MNDWTYEIYLKNEKTGESGWSIETGYVKAETKEKALNKIKEKHSLFDCVITLHSCIID